MDHLRHSTPTGRAFIELVKAIINNEGVECEQLPEFFFPQRDAMNQIELEINVAKTVCAECPVKNLCLEYAVIAKEPYGIWGGTTPEERRKLTLLHAS